MKVAKKYLLMHYENIKFTVIAQLMKSDNEIHSFHLLVNIINEKRRKTSTTYRNNEDFEEIFRNSMKTNSQMRLN